MADRLIRATAAEGGIRAVGVISTRLTEEARRRHKMSNVATAALGRAMASGLLLASSMKKEGSRVNIRVRGDGPLGGLLIDAGLNGTVRGYVEYPDVELPPKPNGKLDVGRAIGENGLLSVLRDEGYGEPFYSTVQLVSGEIGEDVSHYLVTSEQTPSALLVGVFVGTLTGVSAAGGILLQVLPKAARDELEEIFQELLGDMGLEIMPAVQMVRFDCGCSHDRVLGALKLLGVDELLDMIETDKQAEATCHFCGEVYNATEAQLIELVESMRAESC
jgi:molecular chaperone Hsp33